MKNKDIKRYILSAIFISLSIIFVIKTSGPLLLKAYIENGIGNCEKIPILCMVPDGKNISSDINDDYKQELIPYEFPKSSVFAPRGFSVVEETLKKVYYKKHKRMDAGSIIFLLYEKKDFFVNLFPQLQIQGVNNDYEFFRRMMFANLKEIKTITDAFFVIMKGIFIPDLGQQEAVTMTQFNLKGKFGFINYNFAKTGNFFDCDIFNKQGDFFKVYIKDKKAELDLNKVLIIISMLSKQK